MLLESRRNNGFDRRNGLFCFVCLLLRPCRLRGGRGKVSLRATSFDCRCQVMVLFSPLLPCLHNRVGGQWIVEQNRTDRRRFCWLVIYVDQMICRRWEGLFYPICLASHKEHFRIEEEEDLVAWLGVFRNWIGGRNGITEKRWKIMNGSN